MKFTVNLKKFLCVAFGFALVLVPYYTARYLECITLPEKMTELGVSTVKLMYEFETPGEILSNQEKLKDILSEEEFDELCIDNELRTVNAYYKFGYSESAVNVVKADSNYVIYTLDNENIDRDTKWLFLFDVVSGRVCNVREYMMVLDNSSEVFEDK